MELDEAPSQGKTQSRALLLMGLAHLLELLEDPGLVRRGDADPIVPHQDEHLVAVTSGADLDMATPGGELQRVGEQVEEHLLELSLVGIDVAGTRVYFEPQAAPVVAELVDQQRRVEISSRCVATSDQLSQR
jgi:hypothetical protein